MAPFTTFRRATMMGDRADGSQGFRNAGRGLVELFARSRSSLPIIFQSAESQIGECSGEHPNQYNPHPNPLVAAADAPPATHIDPGEYLRCELEEDQQQDDRDGKEGHELAFSISSTVTAVPYASISAAPLMIIEVVSRTATTAFAPKASARFAMRSIACSRA